MRNITVSADDDAHRRARIEAAEDGASVSAAARDSPIRCSGEETEFDRRKRLQHETLRGIDAFSAGDRLPREEIHRREASPLVEAAGPPQPGIRVAKLGMMGHN